MRRRLFIFLAAFVAVLTLTPTAAHAVWYWYEPSHPMRLNPNQLWCTGAWAIRGESGMFFLSAGHCFERHHLIYGATSRFGTIARDEFVGDTWNSGEMDALLVQPGSGVDAMQQVSGFGRVTGKYSNAYLAQAGHPIGKLGQSTGWTTGVTQGGWWSLDGEPVLCATYARAGGDSGAPVFTFNNGRVTAAGMHVGAVPNPNGGPALGCYLPIDSLLSRFGAWLPVFSSLTAKQPTLIGPSADLAHDVPVRMVEGGVRDAGPRLP